MLINNTQFECTCEEVVSELRQQLHANGIRLLEKDPKPSGDNIQIQCPYHKNGQERRLSAGIKKDTGVFHCFGCGETHTLPELISYCFGYTDDVMGSWGWQWLVKNYLSVSIEERKNVRLDFARNNDRSSVFNSNSTNDNNTYVSEEELDSYRYIHPYLETRGITDDSIIELFDIGYDRATKCITFPVRNEDGNCLFVARRSVQTKFFNYPAHAEKPLYGLYELSLIQKQVDKPLIVTSGILSVKPISEVWVCESMIDCILLWQSGRYAVAMNGIGNELQFNQLRDLFCRVLVLATDMDDAGIRARDTIKKKVSNKIIKEVFLPEGRKDIGECTSEELYNLEAVL